MALPAGRTGRANIRGGMRARAGRPGYSECARVRGARPGSHFLCARFRGMQNTSRDLKSPTACAYRERSGRTAGAVDILTRDVRLFRTSHRRAYYATNARSFRIYAAARIALNILNARDLRAAPGMAAQSRYPGRLVPRPDPAFLAHAWYSGRGLARQISCTRAL